MRAAAHGSALPNEKIDDYVCDELQKQNIPGVSLAIVREGTVLKSKGYGLSNLELSVPVHPDTVFQIGSISKQFTAAGILLLWEEGKVDPDERVGEYLNGLPDAWKSITLRQMLHHTSGLTEVTELPGFTYRRDYSKEELINLLAPHPLEFEPGTRWMYSNTGYVLLGWIIEEASGQSFGEFFAERIFRPIGMENTRTIDYDEIVPNRAAGYCRQDGGPCRGELLRPKVIVGAGGLLSTALDLAKWDAALYTDSPLSDRLKTEMWSPARLNDGSLAETTETCGKHYGFGWFLGEHRGRRSVSHTGQTDAGFTSEIFRIPEEALTILLLGNVEPMKQDRMVKYITDLILG